MMIKTRTVYCRKRRLKMRNNILLIPALLLFLAPAQAQDNRTTQAFEWSDLKQLILANHPLVRQAKLLQARAQAELTSAKGGFDLKTYADYQAKDFKGTNYFQMTEAGLKLPTWLGLELKGAYNYANGNYLNPENALPAAGQATFGLNWTLGQGLMIDERRAQLRQSRVGILQYDAERNLLVNDVLLDAAKAYWNWVLANNQLSIYQEALKQARVRHDALRESFLYGDKPGIDTVETFIQLQTREMDVWMATLETKNTAAELSNHLWFNTSQQNTPPDRAPALNSGAFPEPDSQAVGQLVRQALSTHPALVYYRSKSAQLDIEKLLKREKRKPFLDLSYHILGSGWTFFSGVDNEGVPGVLLNDIKWGLNFSFPLQNRKARGDYQITRLKIAQNDLAIAQKTREIENKITVYQNELNTLARQIGIQAQQVDRYRLLLQAEQEKFLFGESSVFLINTREQRWLESQIKFQKLLG